MFTSFGRLRALPRLLTLPVLAWVMAAMAVGAGYAGVAVAQQPSATPSSKALLPLIVSIGQESTRYADLFIAQYEGFFKKAGVDVTIANNGTQYMTVMLSGRADVTVSGTPGLLTLRNRGRDLKAIYATTYGSDNGFVVATNSPYRTADDLGKAGARVATVMTGGQLQGIVTGVSNYLVAQGGKPFKLMAGSGSEDFISLVAAGTVDTTLADPILAARYIEARKVRWVSDLGPNSALLEKISPRNLPSISIIGNASTLTAKAVAITRFIAALRMAERWLKENSDETIADVLHSDKSGGVFGQLEVILIRDALQYDRALWPTKQEGYISRENWNDALPVWTSWQFGWNGSDPFASYDSAVDMSYWNASNELFK